MTVRCDCYLAGHASYVHIDARPPDEPWWTEYVDLYEQMTEFFAIGRDALERVAEWLRKVYISVRDALVSLAERVAAVIEPRHKLSVPPPIFVPPRIPDAFPRSSTLEPVKLAARSPP